MTTTESKVQGLLENNRKFAETWATPPTMVQMRAATVKNGGALIVGPLPVTPIRYADIPLTQHLPVTCIDPRVVPERFFGPDFSNAVVRNAGGRVNQDVINSITVLRSLAEASAVLVVHHTGKHALLLLIVRFSSERAVLMGDQIAVSLI